MHPRLIHLLLLCSLSLLPSSPSAASIAQESAPALHTDSEPAGITREDATKSLASLLQPFIENQGQFNEQVAYAIRLGNGTIFLDRQGALVFSFVRPAPPDDQPPGPEANTDPQAQTSHCARTNRWSSASFLRAALQQSPSKAGKKPIPWSTLLSGRGRTGAAPSPPGRRSATREFFPGSMSCTGPAPAWSRISMNCGPGQILRSSASG